MDEQKEAIDGEETILDEPVEAAQDSDTALAQLEDQGEADEAAAADEQLGQAEGDPADPAPADQAAPEEGAVTSEAADSEAPSTEEAAVSAGREETEEAAKPAAGIGDLVIVGILAIILGVLLALPSFLGLVGGEEAPGEGGAASGVAATVNGVAISEGEVTEYVMNFRSEQGLEDDQAWGEWLVSYGYTPEALRSDTVEFFVNRELLAQAARDESIEVADSEVDEFVDSLVEQLGGEEAFEQAMEAEGLDMEEYRSQVRSSLEQQALMDKVASSDVKVDDSEVLDIIKLYYPDAVEEDADSLDGVDEETVGQVRSMLESSAIQQAFSAWMDDYRSKADVVMLDAPALLPYAVDLDSIREAMEAEADADGAESAGSDDAEEGEDEGESDE